MRVAGLAAGLALACGSPQRAGPNVVLLVVDALRADHLGCYGYARPTSPFVDELAARSVVFEDVTSAASQTAPAMSSVLSALYPHRHGIQYFPLQNAFSSTTFLSGAPSVESLAEILRARGYATAAVMTNPHLGPENGFDRGFDVYDFLSRDEPPVRRLPAVHIHRRAARLLDRELEEPFFLYLHYMDVHSPYTPREPWISSFAAGSGRNVYLNGPLPGARPEDVAFTRALYDSELRHLDDRLRELFTMLDRRGLLESTLVVFTADHGDEFLDHGGMGHGWTLYNEVLQVPLLLSQRGRLDARRVGTPISHVDLLPTLLELLGIPVPPGRDGRSVAGLVDGSDRVEPRVLLSELGDLRAARRGDAKRIRSFRGPGRDLVFDLAIDPGESRPREPAPGGALEAALSALPPPAAPEGSPKAVDPLLRRQLEELGYVD